MKKSRLLFVFVAVLLVFGLLAPELRAEKKSGESPLSSEVKRKSDGKSGESPLSSEVKLKDEDLKKAEEGYILDVEVAEAAMVESDGFPVKGTLAGLGGASLRLRAWPWGEVIRLYPEGTKVEVRGVSGEFYLVDINGVQGYMHRNYVSIPDRAASGVEPSYPGDTRSGGALPIEEGVKISIDDSKKPAPSPSEPSPSNPSNPGKPPVLADGGAKMDLPIQNQLKVKCPRPNCACGPTSLSMMVAYKTGKQPGPIASDLYNVCGTNGNGTGHAGLVKGAKKYGFNAKFYYSVGLDWLKKQLKAGKPCLCHVKGHYVVVTGFDKNNNIYVNDPYPGVKKVMHWSKFQPWWRASCVGQAAMVME